MRYWTATAALMIGLVPTAPIAAAAAGNDASTTMVAVREFAVQGEVPGETPSRIQRELANSLAEALKSQHYQAQVITENKQPPRAARYVVDGTIDARRGSLAGRISSFGLAGRAKIVVSVEVRDNRSGAILKKFEESASSGSWKGKEGPIVSCARQVGQAVGKQVAKTVASAPVLAKVSEPAPQPQRPRPQPAIAPTAAPQTAALSAIATHIVPLLVGSWQSGSGTLLKFDDTGGVVETTDPDNRRTGHYEILDSEQIVLTFGAHTKGGVASPDRSGGRASSYLVKYKLNGDELTLIYLDAEVWKYKRQR